MKPNEHLIKVEKTARYFTNNVDEINIKSVLIVIHGYAQLARDFISEFDFFDSNDTLIIAPEGLSKFYSRNGVAASWMTKEDRVNEINDYINYLDKILEEVKDNYGLTSVKMNVLGYSQGVHTSVRWFIGSKFHFQNLILCSSDFPKDAEFDALREKLCNSKMYYISGSEDKIISQDIFEKNIDLLKSNRINFEELIFKGGHEINKDSVAKILNK